MARVQPGDDPPGRLPLWNDLAGCGAPHLANGQSAVFDPFHLIAYLGPLPGADAWMAAARLWVAGLGMFLLARSWGLGAWGRWFAGLSVPVLRVPDRLAPVPGHERGGLDALAVLDERPGARTAGPRNDRRALALVVGCVLLGGHVQTSAHVLLASGVYVAWRFAAGIGGRSLLAWRGGRRCSGSV